jgi:hypothetical protein
MSLPTVDSIKIVLMIAKFELYTTVQRKLQLKSDKSKSNNYYIRAASQHLWN